jgi:hypothetical protein
MTPENEALIAKAEILKLDLQKERLPVSFLIVDSLIAALRAADERERELVEALETVADYVSDAIQGPTGTSVSLRQLAKDDFVRIAKALRGKS